MEYEQFVLVRHHEKCEIRLDHNSQCESFSYVLFHRIIAIQLRVNTLLNSFLLPRVCSLCPDEKQYFIHNNPVAFTDYRFLFHCL